MRQVYCTKYKKKLSGLNEAPISGDLGNFILNNISKQAWQEWQKQQVILINENHLKSFEPTARQFLQEQMQRFFANKKFTPFK